MLRKIAIGLLTAVAAVACATSPTGRSQLILIPESEMTQMGTQAFQQMQRQQEVSGNRRVQRYVECVADEITAELQGDWAQTDWEVVVFEDDSANAFALPGGKIGVHTGLLDVARNQDQLATVVGHEIGHVIARHGAERVSQQFAASTALQLVNTYVGEDSSNSSKLAMALLGLGTQVGVLLPYSRIQESEADVIGVDLMARAGFDPRQSVDLWQNMAAQGGARPPEFLSTHPAPQSRIEELRKKMPQAVEVYRGTSNRPSCG